MVTEFFSSFRQRYRQARDRFRWTWPGRVLHCLFVRKRSFITWIAIMFAFQALSTWIDIHTPTLPLEALDRHSGVLVDIADVRRAACRSQIRVRGDDGQTRWWRLCIWDTEKYRKAIGQRIVFWTQYILTDWMPIPPWHYDEVLHVETADGQVIKDYHELRPNMLQNRKPGGAFWKFYRFFLYAIFFFAGWVLLWCARDLLREYVGEAGC